MNPETFVKGFALGCLFVISFSIISIANSLNNISKHLKVISSSPTKQMSND